MKNITMMFFPEKNAYEFDYHKGNLWRCRYTSADAKSLHYKMLLPLTVKPISIKPKLVEGVGNLYTIGSYQTISEAQSPFMEVDVVYEHIENDIDASDWLDKVLSFLGEEVNETMNSVVVRKGDGILYAGQAVSNKFRCFLCRDVLKLHGYRKQCRIGQ